MKCFPFVSGICYRNVDLRIRKLRNRSAERSEFHAARINVGHKNLDTALQIFPSTDILIGKNYQLRIIRYDYKFLASW